MRLICLAAACTVWNLLLCLSELRHVEQALTYASLVLEYLLGKAAAVAQCPGDAQVLALKVAESQPEMLGPAA